MVDEPKVKVKVYLEDFLEKFQLVANKVTSWSGTASDDKYPSAKLVKDSLDGKSDNGHTHNKSDITDFTHAHGNLTNDGKVGTNSGYFITTTTGGAITSKQKIGNITTDGKVGTSANKPLITTTKGVVTTGSFGTSANSFCEGNDSRLSDARTPLAHTHDLDDITDYMVTSISCNDYNPTIDGTVTLTVTVKDVYGDAVSGESVLVTASAGNFTKYNGSTITGASSYTGTTNSSGQFTLTYTCSEWGLITFSANNENIQIKVTGWKQIIVNTYCTLYVNGDERICEFKYYQTNVSFTSTSDKTVASNLIPTEYRPVGSGVPVALFNPKLGGNINGDNGNFSVAPTETGNKTVNAHAIWVY